MWCKILFKLDVRKGWDVFPLYDENPRETRPFVNWVIIAINVVVFIWEFESTAGFTDGHRFMSILSRFGSIPVVVIDSLETLNPVGLATVFTSMFMHSGFPHLIGNMIYLYVFGDNIEDTFGHLRYLVLYLIFGLTASLIHSYYAILSGGYDPFIPAVGASGAISGVLGAYLVLFPRARVVSILFLGYILRPVVISSLYYIGFWFLLQFVLGVLSGGVGGVAYWAHIGGFIAGVAVAYPYRLIDRRRLLTLR